MMAWVFGIAAAYLMLRSTGDAPAASKPPGPFDATPPGTDRAPFAQQATRGQFSGRDYQATMYRNVQGDRQLTYSVVVDTDTNEWIGWLWHQANNARIYWRGVTKSEASLAEIKKDFGV
jgi:hypothetical protein